jgi:uncharacterized protein
MNNSLLKVILLGLGTLLIFGVTGYIIIVHFQEVNFIDILKSGRSLPVQLIIGIIYGLLSAFIALYIINKEFFNKEKQFYQEKISQLNLNNSGIVFISICAGIGEEIFFRAALQPFLGIWITSIFFVAVHGYLNPLNWVISLYGIFMTFVIAGFGYLMESFGLITVITAHAIFDLVLLKTLTNSNSIKDSN